MKKVEIKRDCALWKQGEIIEVSENVFLVYKNYLKELKDYRNKAMKKGKRVKTK